MVRLTQPAHSMKILIYSEYFLPVIGGVQTFTDLLAKGLSEANTAIVAGDAAQTEATVVTNSRRGEMDDGKLSYGVIRRPTFGKLVRCIREADLVHVEGPCFLPMLVSWMIRKPYVVEHHVYQAICPNGLLFKNPGETPCAGHFDRREYAECLRCCAVTMGRTGAVRALLLAFPRRWLCKRATVNVMVTNHVKRRLRMPNSVVIYCGIDDPEPASADATVRTSDIIEFGYVGRLVAEKGLLLLIEAANQLAKEGNRYRLTFVGDGPERARLEALVLKYDLCEHVHFAGEKRGTDFVRVANEIDVTIMPSIWEETAGLAAIEQMMRGRLIIAADIGGLGEIVDGAGLKFKPGDWQNLAVQMRRVIEDPSLVKTIGSAARARAEEFFRRDLMINRQLDLCRQVVRR